jgi:hypothetical protein
MPRPRRAAALLLALAAAAALAAGPARAALTAEQANSWAGYMQDLERVHVGSETLKESLGRVLSHEYSTPLPAVQSASVYTGGNARLRRVVADLTYGRPVTIVALGGLATNGSDASAPGKNDYFARYVSYLAKAFPNARIKPVRATVGLAPSAVVVACLEKHLPTDADLVLLEMNANDGATMDSSIPNPGQPKAYEMLVRRVLGGNKQPALVLTQVRAGGAAQRLHH